MKKGIILVNALVFAAIAVTVTIALVNWGAQTLKTVRTLTQREQAFQIAEAGIDYYRWHLAHFPADYTDGTTTPQPYVHAFEDELGNTIGHFDLTVTAPPIGSTLVTVKSKGVLAADPTIYRTIQATLGKPSFARYAFAADDFMRFGSGTTVNGPIHSNKGIHFDGLALSTVSSALATTTDPDNNCGSPANCALEWAVFTQVGTDDPQPLPVNNPSPTFQQLGHQDVFPIGRSISVPNISFSSITNDLSVLKQAAHDAEPATDRYNLPDAGSGYYGYHMVFADSAGTTTYRLYKVTALVNSPSNSCTSSQNQASSQTNWGTWSIASESAYPSAAGNTFHLPSTGVIFAADNVWVDGTVGDGARVTIAVGVLPAPPPPPAPDIIINSDLKYTLKDGSEVIGLIAQGNVTVGLNSGNTMEIDGALVAQGGRVGRFYYNGNCGVNNDRTTLNLYGMIATAVRYGFAYGDPPTSGYQTRNITYDPNLLYGPPPSFPLSSSQYVPLSWKEIQ